MVVNYAEHRERYSAKNTRGLKNAVDKCDEFLSDPTVSDETYTYFLHILHIPFLSILSRNSVTMLTLICKKEQFLYKRKCHSQLNRNPI